MIRVRMEDEKDLCWLLAREYEGEMGKRSTSGGILDAIERGALVQMPGKSGDIGERALKAARRYEIITRKLRRCSLSSRIILAAAFGPTRYPELEAFGEFAGAALATPEAVKAHRESGTTRSLLDWLQRLGKAARTLTGKEQQTAMSRVAVLREAMETRLAAALAEYGAGVETVVGRETVTVREIARALDIDHHTVAARLTERRIPWGRRSDRANEAARIKRADLATLWPEAERALGT